LISCACVLPSRLILFDLTFSLVPGPQGFTLTKQVLYRFSQTSSPFYSGYFGDGGLTKYLPHDPPPSQPPKLGL
jgi:hypothetical protein